MATEEFGKVEEVQKKHNEQTQKNQKTFLSGMFKMFKKASDNTKVEREKATDEVGKQVSEVFGKEMSQTAAAISGIIKGDMDKVVGEVTTQTSDVLGPEITKVASIATGSIKSTIGIGKALFGKSEDEEESKSDKKRNGFLEMIVDHFKVVQKRWSVDLGGEDPKKSGVLGKVMMAGALLVGVIVGYTTKITEAFGPLFRVMKGLTGKLTNIFKGFGKVGKFFKAGKLIGKILLPVEMIVKAITGIFSGDTLRDKLLGMSAGLLDPILFIPEIIGNSILWLARKVFGEDFLKGFSFDFGMDAIIDSINKVTEMAEPFIHGLLDGVNNLIGMWEEFSLLNLITEASKKLINFFTNLIPGKAMFGKLKGMFGFGGKEEDIETEIPSRRIGGDIVKTGLVNLHKGERVLPAEVVDLPSSVKRKSDFTEINKIRKVIVQSNMVDKKKVEYANRKIQEKQLSAMRKTEVMTQEGSVSVINAISNIQGTGERPIPDEVDNIITSLAVQGAY